MASSNNLFEVTDPRGRTIFCTEYCWNYHILPRRPWMDGWEDRVIAAISNPEFGIYQDAQRGNRNIYYRMVRQKGRYLKVVVDFSYDEVGEVVTAFTTDSPKQGELLIWPQSND